jgi:hypothetical protein
VTGVKECYDGISELLKIQEISKALASNSSPPKRYRDSEERKGRARIRIMRQDGTVRRFLRELLQHIDTALQYVRQAETGKTQI